MRLDNTQIQPVINLLGDIVRSSEIDPDKINEGIDSLESMKRIIDVEDEEAVDKIDEMQDYLHYLMSVEEQTVSEEVKEEITDMIGNLERLYL